MARIDSLNKSIDRLIQFWKNQSIRTKSNPENALLKFEAKNNIKLPNDFFNLYLRLNGMEHEYPNEGDTNGFLFYPLTKIIKYEEEFEEINYSNKEILIFADYLHKSWWYGVMLINEKDDYIIGIMPDKNRFHPITNSLSEFIELYIDDSLKLYEYE